MSDQTEEPRPNCVDPECAAIALALEAAMGEPPRALAALTTIEAKAAEALLIKFDALEVALDAALVELEVLRADNRRLRELLREGQDALVNDGIDIGIRHGVSETEEWSKKLDAALAQVSEVKA